MPLRTNEQMNLDDLKKLAAEAFIRFQRAEARAEKLQGKFQIADAAARQKSSNSKDGRKAAMRAKRKALAAEEQVRDLLHDWEKAKKCLATATKQAPKAQASPPH